LNLYL